jgi:hypothetical protein
MSSFKLKPVAQTFYFDPLYRRVGDKAVKSHLKLETVFGELTYGILGLLIFCVIYTGLYLFVVISAITTLYDSPALAFAIILGITILFGPIIYITGSRVWHFWRSIQRWRKLKQDGVICRGHVVDCRTEAKSNSDKAEWLKIDYVFTTPQGQELKGKQVKRIPDPVKPPPDTAIAILFAGEHCHVVL